MSLVSDQEDSLTGRQILRPTGILLLILFIVTMSRQWMGQEEEEMKRKRESLYLLVKHSDHQYQVSHHALKPYGKKVHNYVQYVHVISGL